MLALILAIRGSFHRLTRELVRSSGYFCEVWEVEKVTRERAWVTFEAPLLYESFLGLDFYGISDASDWKWSVNVLKNLYKLDSLFIKDGSNLESAASILELFKSGWFLITQI